MSETELGTIHQIPDPPGGDPSLERRLWELQEENTELRARLTEQIERERILELEITAARKDLEVKVAYVTALENAAWERQQDVRWLQDHFDAERARADALSEELRAERSRIVYRISQPLIRLLRGPRPPR